MRYNLKALLIAEAVAPPVLAWLWMALGFFMFLPAIYVITIVLLLDDRT